MKVLLPLLVLCLGMSAQDSVIKVDVDLVNVLCSVRNKGNGLVGNLEKSDFKLFEDGKEMDIKYFTRETDLPLTIGMLVDFGSLPQAAAEPATPAFKLKGDPTAGKAIFLKAGCISCHTLADAKSTGTVRSASPVAINGSP